MLFSLLNKSERERRCGDSSINCCSVLFAASEWYFFSHMRGLVNNQLLFRFVCSLTSVLLWFVSEFNMVVNVVFFFHVVFCKYSNLVLFFCCHRSVSLWFFFSIQHGITVVISIDGASTSKLTHSCIIHRHVSVCGFEHIC